MHQLQSSKLSGLPELVQNWTPFRGVQSNEGGTKGVLDATEAAIWKIHRALVWYLGLDRGVERFLLSDVQVFRKSSVGFGDGDVFVGPGAEGGSFFGGEGADDFGGGAHDHGAGGDFGAGGDDGAGGNEALVADFCTVEDGRAHTDKAFVADGAGVDDGAVAERGVGTDSGGEVVGEMDDTAVLDVAPLPDDDGLNVAAQDGTVEDAGVFAESDVAHDFRVGRDEGGGGEVGLAGEVFF